MEQAAVAIRFRCKRCGRQDGNLKASFIDQNHLPKGYRDPQ